jgi:hypothetical protein
MNRIRMKRIKRIRMKRMKKRSKIIWSTKLLPQLCPISGSVMGLSKVNQDGDALVVFKLSLWIRRYLIGIDSTYV